AVRPVQRRIRKIERTAIVALQNELPNRQWLVRPSQHTRLVSELYARKQATYSENKVYPYAGLDDLRPDLIDKCRRLAGVWRDGHPGWIWMTWS
ncbi:MAG: hypothetical protein R6U55_12375, partial [Desulfovermiculus sp.]